MKVEQYKKLQKLGAYDAMWIELLNASGWAGCDKNGCIVDRRYFPDATPVAKNSMMGIAEPKKIIK